MGVVTGGGGGAPAFNGGTITSPLHIDSAIAGTSGLQVDVPTHTGNSALDVQNDVASIFSVDDLGDANVVGALSVTGNTTLGGGANAVQLYIVPVAAQSSPIMQVFDKLGATPFQLDKDGYLLLATHAAPADAALAAGECALWFDQTNGAAKLMVKAKTANGTVAAASIALA